LRPTPEEIEARRFRLAQNGYDCESVDRFLAEIAESLRGETPTDTADPDEFGRLGQEIASILRNARDAAGAVRAEAEGQAAAVRSRAEIEADDERKAAAAEAEAVRATAVADAEATTNAAIGEAKALRAAAEIESGAIRAEAERRLEAAAQALARAGEQAATVRAEADREVASRIERAEHEARRRSSEIAAEAERHAELIRESEQSTYLRLLAARDDVQRAIDQMVAHAAAMAEADPVVDLTTAPAQVRANAGSDATRAVLRTEPVHAPEPEATPEQAPPSPGFDPGERSVGSVELDANGAAGDPLLRMVRAAVGRAVEASGTDDLDHEASAS
jgi:DivIVA domain-containing protein